MLGLPAGVAEEKVLLHALEEGVWAHPGYFYGVSPSSPCVVLSLLTSPDLFKQGLEGLDKALKRA